MAGKIPVLLLKTKSKLDRYEEYFSTLDNGTYIPSFIPVLKHQLDSFALDSLYCDLTEMRSFHPSTELQGYGGIIFTSQRAVEAFTQVCGRVKNIDDYIGDATVFYVVGPATSRAVAALNLPCPILGEETGNGEALAAFILKDYNARWSTKDHKPALLFLVGEQRRDIIPSTLQNHVLPEHEQIKVEEKVVYATVEHPAFEAQFREIYQKHEQQEQWVVVFSPSGCQSMLNVIRDGPLTKVATIGPTTFKHLKDDMNFEPHVCAPSPSPEALADAIHSFRTNNLLHEQ